jgi:phosphatidylinositol glycan class U
MWLVTGNGNPNYIFFQCFAYGLFVAVITLDVVSATVKRDKVLRMVVKGDTVKSENSPKEGDEGQKEEALDKARKPEVSDEIRNTHSEIESEPEPVVVFL